jgi:soluble lytic murein transglycosylase-like protein
MKKTIFILILSLFISSISIASESNKYLKYNNIIIYDQYFIKYSKQYFNVTFDWRHFKAQSIAESNLNPLAESSVGAEGLMQIMPLTYKEIRNKNSYIKGSAHDPKWAIPAGIYYDLSIYNKWSIKKTFQDKIDYMMASYNAGMGNIIKAQDKCISYNLDPQTWDCITKTLIYITGKHNIETLGYVNRIKIIKEALK